MYLDEQVPGESYRINDFIRAYVLDVKKSPKGPQVILSRAAEGLVQRLLELEVPEIADGTVEIMAIAREPAAARRSPCKSNRPEVDPDRRLPRTEVEPHRQRDRQSARREDRHHSLRRRPGDVHHERARAGQGDRRRTLRGRRRRSRHRSRLSTLAGDRPRRPERATGRPAHGMASRHYERDANRTSPRALLGGARRADRDRGAGGRGRPKRSRRSPEGVDDRSPS